MQKKDEECSKNIKVKEVITVLCKCLSALDVESVPPAEVFRRAKFNKIEAVSDPGLSSPKPSFTQHTQPEVFNDHISQKFQETSVV